MSVPPFFRWYVCDLQSSHMAPTISLFKGFLVFCFFLNSCLSWLRFLCVFFLSIEDNQSVLPERSIEEKYNRSRLISSFQSGSPWYMKGQLDLIEVDLRVTRSRWLDNKSALPSSPALSFPLLHASPPFSPHLITCLHMHVLSSPGQTVRNNHSLHVNAQIT